MFILLIEIFMYILYIICKKMSILFKYFFLFSQIKIIKFYNTQTFFKLVSILRKVVSISITVSL